MFFYEEDEFEVMGCSEDLTIRNGKSKKRQIGFKLFSIFPSPPFQSPALFFHSFSLVSYPQFHHDSLLSIM